MRPAAGFLTKCFDLALSAIYPPKCCLCGLIGRPAVCLACQDGFHEAEPQLETRPDDASLEYRAVAYRYEDRAAQAVRRLKYGRSTALIPFMAERLRETHDHLALDPDLVVPVPIHWSRRFERGFNQAEALCAELDWAQGVLRRVRRTRPQVGLSREERIRNLEGAFRASEEARGRRVLLVDDVLTSGQTARECARALRAAGAVEVGILAFCGEA